MSDPDIHVFRWPPKDVMRRLTDFDPDIHVAPFGEHVAELHSDHSEKVLPLNRLGLEVIRPKVEDGGSLFGNYFLRELPND